MKRAEFAILILQGVGIALLVWFLLTLVLGAGAEIVDTVTPG